jgi:hypothetical protein
MSTKHFFLYIIYRLEEEFAIVNTLLLCERRTFAIPKVDFRTYTIQTIFGKVLFNY